MGRYASGVYNHYVCVTKGNYPLSYYFNLDEIIIHYEKLGLDNLNKAELQRLFELPALEIFSPYGEEYDHRHSDDADAIDIIRGLVLGYPLESTVSFINGTNKF